MKRLAGGRATAFGVPRHSDGSPTMRSRPARARAIARTRPTSMQTKDGYLMVGGAGEAIRARCAKALGHPEWCEDPCFATNQARMANREALEAVMKAVLTTKTTSDWVEMLDAAGVL